MKRLTALTMKGMLSTAALLMALCFMASITNAQNPGTGVVTVASNGGCLAYTAAQSNGPDNWEVAEGGSYTMTITGVTECTGPDITVFIQSSSGGNWCFNASGEGGTYIGNFTMPSQACYTMPISYKCGANQSCDNSDAYDADGPSNNHKVHLRASFFDGSCNRTGTDEDCGTCIANIGISAGGSTTVCEGNCVTLTATGGTSYLWSNGATTASIEACEEGDYSVVGSDANGCTGSSSPTHITVVPPPTVTVTADGPTTVCSPSCVTLNASGATSYVWSPNGETTASISACATGEYSVVGTDDNGCSSASDPVSVTVNETPSCSLTAPETLPVCGLGGNTLTVSITGITTSIVWTVSPSSWVITNGQGTSQITYTAGDGGTEATFTVTVYNGDCSSSCYVSFGNRCEEHCGYTQGFYGGNGKTCDQTQTAIQAINAALSSGGNLVSGISGVRSVTILTTEGSCLNSKLPGSVGPTLLPAGSNITCAGLTGALLKNGRMKNVLLAQTIALGLNIRNDASLGGLVISDQYVTTYKASSCVNGVAIGSNRTVRHIPQSVLNCLETNGNLTVQGLLNLANQTLAGQGPCAANPSDVNDAVDAINNAFDGCRILGGFGNNSAGLREINGEDGNLLNANNELQLAIYPNPATETSVLLFTSPENGNAAVELYSANGVKVSTLYNNEVTAEEPVGVTLDATSLAPGIYTLRLVAANTTVFKRLVVIK